MSSKLFQASCEMLWGSQYQRAAAVQLGIGLRSVQRYDYGERTVPDKVLKHLASLLRDRQTEIDKLLPKVTAAHGGRS
jgi:hypothetical protein